MPTDANEPQTANEPTAVKALLLDIGGVLLSKGWGREARAQAAERFGYDHDEVEERHSAVFVPYEEGDLTLDEYLDLVVFYEPRDFSREEYRDFIFAQSTARPADMEMFRRLKEAYGLKIVAVSNEGRELALHRVRTFQLDTLMDFFVFSCFVHHRKPDPAVYCMAYNQTLLTPEQVVYIDDSALLADMARKLGLPAIRHTDPDTTLKELASFGLTLP
jgi:putative hydrolase of the HAD superfamily